jgi:formyltetrahydrofolate deformylase
MTKDYTILIDCKDDKGLVFKITDLIYRHELNITSNLEFVDHESHHFFMRTVVHGQLNESEIHEELTTILPNNARIRISSSKKKRIVILATKEHHVLGDILIRHEFDEINAEILGVISNHEVLEPLVKKFDVPFHFIPHQGLDREVHEKQILKILDNYSPDFIVLAKYMRILNPEFITPFKNKIINIHHSFLPAFIGAKPYQQAYNRGVKIIGATAHFVNADLDEGPIITQSTRRVDHTHNAEKMSQLGKEIESRVLSEALQLTFEDKVFIQGNKTIILD